MYIHEPTFDIDELFRMNLHIHSTFSRCAKREMLLPDIVKTAQAAGLKLIAITDHIGPSESALLRRNLPELKRQLSQTDTTELRVLLGAELSAYGIGKYSLKYGEGKGLEYRLYAHNHYHVWDWEQPEGHSPADYKEHCKKVLESVIKSKKADCLAHPFSDAYIVHKFSEQYGFTENCIISLWTDNEIGDLLELAKRYEVAWELNASHIPACPEFYRRFFNLGRETNACFNVGTDAHQLKNVDSNSFKTTVKTCLI